MAILIPMESLSCVRLLCFVHRDEPLSRLLVSRFPLVLDISPETNQLLPRMRLC